MRRYRLCKRSGTRWGFLRCTHTRQYVVYAAPWIGLTLLLWWLQTAVGVSHGAVTLATVLSIVFAFGLLFDAFFGHPEAHDPERHHVKHVRMLRAKRRQHRGR